MEFWGVEVKAREPLKCEPGFYKCVHISLNMLKEDLERDDEDGDEDGSSKENEIEDMLEGEGRSDDEDKSFEEEEEATPKKKAKLVTPGIQNTGGKNGGHIATPYPAPPATCDNWRPQTTLGNFVCCACRIHFLTFDSLQEHNKSMHGVYQVLEKNGFVSNDIMVMVSNQLLIENWLFLGGSYRFILFTVTL
ncbi:uncharacterized protein LOC143881844 isoform X2 [Tasmannia lanceolata]|uniref:uncharacterized protein LOC143881844 isoform X2 n=1 Tax=Tasmannia lanceolata TaxID=3420 RepID=UPI004063A5E9